MTTPTGRGDEPDVGGNIFRGINFQSFIGQQRQGSDDFLGPRPAQQSADSLGRTFDKLRESVEKLIQSTQKAAGGNRGGFSWSNTGQVGSPGTGQYSTMNGGGPYSITVTTGIKFLLRELGLIPL